MIEITPLALTGVFEIKPPKFGDDRGFFSETYNAQALAKAGIDLQFVQDNHSLSAAKGVLRGLHYQLPPRAQDKLVRVVSGSILDVVVDIRKSSPTFGKWLALEVSATKWNQILVPKGFAHGFLTLEENTEVIYKVTDYYSPEHDRNIRFDDPSIGIEWPFEAAAIQLSDKDRKAPLLDGADIFP
ncbi:dTDP-4-dehydrorhamnose 3,5-epimerase [Phyllobacterium zundukense]|uniref:dTDP-4-dehydrorhamnose 3,5-epimerase n=1 Tax=Phyllobacterium zundukense TaxID=1867719 RepID=A0ACD4D2F3_9HYPH|nr:dTDP-4-dehydrorhamnose 3,5-epimerase [Phyllobacterium zundukense]UXN60020.1 dTDP-4-dehydrorhamnose 3,5-epimerase [Phyllobacterium zundukense]